MFFLFFQISPVCVCGMIPGVDRKERNASFFFCWANFEKSLWWWCNTNAGDGNGWAVIITIYQRDFLPFRDFLIWERAVFLLFCFHGDYPDLVGSKWRFYPPIQSPSRHTVRWSTSFESPVIFLFLAITRFHFPLVPFHWARKQALCWSPLSLYQMQIDPLWLEWIRLLQPLAGEDCRKKEIWPEKRLAWNPPT